eukprot:255153_1
MSKRKTPEKSSLNGPRAKRQKLMHDTSDNRITLDPQSIATSRIHAAKSCINAHCYNHDVTTLQQSSVIELKKHPQLSNAKSGNASLSAKEFDKLCATIHQRVKIYWKEDKQWYYGTIKDYKPSTKESLIVYDDDESEWLNLTKSGHETVEFLHDTPPPSSLDDNPNLRNISIGQQLSSGRVKSTFNHGFISTKDLKLDNQNTTNVTTISFDTQCIQHVLQQTSIDSSADVLRLLHFCQFDASHTSQHEDQTNGHSSSYRKRKRNPDMENNTNIPAWITIGCTEDSDPVTQIDDESHITLIHSNDKGSVNKRTWGQYGTTSGKSKSKSKGKKHEPQVYNKNV